MCSYESDRPLRISAQLRNCLVSNGAIRFVDNMFGEVSAG